jgi:YD repeat-containing protein
MYTWDAFGRLTKVQTNASTPVTVAEFTYDARTHRTAWKHPQAGGGGSAPEAQWRYATYDHRWRMIGGWHNQHLASAPIV